MRILLIEDDRSVGEIVQTSLAARGYEVHRAATGRHGLEVASKIEPDLIILDLGLPDIDGIAVCRRLRRWFTNPIIVLSADGAEDRKVDALDEGADDYVTKPFSMPELLARLRVAGRHRQVVASVVGSTLLLLGDLSVDTGSRQVLVAGEPIRLTKREFDLLELLARNPGKVVTHGLILGKLWGKPDSSSSNSLRVHASILRRKLGTGPLRPSLAVDAGVGYRLSLSESRSDSHD